VIKLSRHSETHFAERMGWLRAAVLGANDGIVSTASLVVGVASSGAASGEVMLAGVASLVAGAMSMAAGEYVSVSSQADTEKADLAREHHELINNPEFERQELAQIYESRGLAPELAHQVAEQLMAHDALGAHARDELGLSEIHAARPMQAAGASAATFAVGASLPLLLAWVVPRASLTLIVSGGSLICLGVLGAVAARAGGANPWVAARRVGFWGAAAMVATAAVGALFGTSVA